MSRETVLFRAKETRPRSGVSAFLRDLADKMDEGTVTLRSGDTAHEIVLPAHVVLEIKLEDEEKPGRGLRHSLEIEMKWYDGMDAPAGIELG